MITEKTCRYQVQDADLFCAAAWKDADKTIIGTQGMRHLAPTSRPLCLACALPDTDHICSRLLHPKVVGQTFMDGAQRTSFKRQLMGGFCDAGNDDKMRDGSQCYAGGNDCWERIFRPEIQVGAVPYSPRDLPIALDFLNTIWELTFKKPLLRLRSVEKISGITFDCATIEEFKSRMSDLTDLLKLFDIPNTDNTRAIPKDQTFNRLTAFLEEQLPAERHAELSGSVARLAAVNAIRNRLQHSGREHELLAALAELGIEYPIASYSKAWEVVRSKTAEALSVIRAVIQSLIEASGA